MKDPTAGRLLSGLEAAALWRAETAGRVGALADLGIRVGLATLLVGDDPASMAYVRRKHQAAEAAGMRSIDRRLPAQASPGQVEAAIDDLNSDPVVHGYLVQLPLPPQVDPARILERIDPAKDADGLHPQNLGRLMLGLPGPRPATPTGILRLLDHHGVATSGRSAVVVGRSSLVGRPLAVMLSSPGRDATVTVAHTRTPDLASVTRDAEIVVAAAGSPGLIGRDHVAPGAFVVDVGTTRVGDALAGDVRFEEVMSVAGGVSPVPGGVGPMTIAALLANVVGLVEGW
ncbi:MAG: bifunctional 5,10-methylenetetrahydrofolate dehydrogenase/5,10-methenyltetrahydrofolate cyclohydrolase [Acidimicrobiia bacterium]|nr:MAG: bifunctional 5,10-methylenetetrahydrofolate dehydrogenase/5,10-methenyltetrahydrofolate cyclohydrolase [Acidimicrobiia bacterium]